MQPVCFCCGETYNPLRLAAQLQHTLPKLCLVCGDVRAKQHKHTIVPMHKSNYVPITNLEDLKGINSKGGWYR